jgi:hypothetical protein
MAAQLKGRPAFTNMDEKINQKAVDRYCKRMLQNSFGFFYPKKNAGSEILDLDIKQVNLFVLRE